MSMAHTISGLAAVISQQRGAVELLAGHMQVVSSKSARNVAGVEKLAEQTDRTVQLIEGWRSTLAAENIENKVLYLAQADHLLWKKRLLDMATGRSKLKSSELTDHTLCRLGKWYYNEGNRYANLPSFAAIEEPHKKVHFHGIEAAKCFETQRLDEGMVHYRQLDAASHEVLAEPQIWHSKAWPEFARGSSRLASAARSGSVRRQAGQGKAWSRCAICTALKSSAKTKTPPFAAGSVGRREPTGSAVIPIQAGMRTSSPVGSRST